MGNIVKQSFWESRFENVIILFPKTQIITMKIPLRERVRDINN